MTDLNQYLRDGADAQSRAILCVLQELEIDGWEVTRWSDGREQGYTIYRKTYEPNIRQRNITFSEACDSHRVQLIIWHFSTLAGCPPSSGDFKEGSASSEIVFETYDAFDFKSIVDRISGLMAEFD